MTCGYCGREKQSQIKTNQTQMGHLTAIATIEGGTPLGRADGTSATRNRAISGVCRVATLLVK